jgi:hypothetical protein
MGICDAPSEESASVVALADFSQHGVIIQTRKRAVALKALPVSVRFKPAHVAEARTGCLKREAVVNSTLVTRLPYSCRTLASGF